VNLDLPAQVEDRAVFLLFNCLDANVFLATHPRRQHRRWSWCSVPGRALAEKQLAGN
jgi:hypothetical protein